MARALKVFSYSDGFHSWTVAASSRAKALEAWGVKRDLFKDGSAVEAAEGPDRQAALSAPGRLVERGLSVDIGKVEMTKAPKPAGNRTPGPRDLARVGALELALAELDEARTHEASALEAQREALEEKAAALHRSHAKASAALKARLKHAREKLAGKTD